VDEELIAAALLHDVGWLLPRPASGALLTAAPGTEGTAEEVFIARHDATGAAHLRALGFSHRLCALVAGHVAAKRYLVATEPAYAAALSPGSTWTLAQQGGPMSPGEAAAFAAHPLTPLCLALRRWDEAAKVPGLATPPWEAHAPRLRRVLAAAAAQWAAAASRYGVAVILPEPSDPQRWGRDDIRAVARALDSLRSRRPVDASRIAVAGRGPGGTFGWLVAEALGPAVRGVALLDAALPRQAVIEPTEPGRSRWVLFAVPLTGGPPKVDADRATLDDNGYQVGVLPEVLGDEPPAEELCRWVESLGLL
jgi:predicted HD phosphohydrolase